MIALLRESWDFLAHVVATSPAQLWPLLLALVGSITFTQAVKKDVIPPSCSDRATARWCQLTAVLSGMLITYLVMPDRPVLVAGTIVGAASPFLYYVGVRIIGARWPITREWLSQQER